jgi:glycosyltransferase involved in cell wall biosynthesis
MPPDATIVITTKNRKDDLRRALASAVAQDGSVEVLVIDDGSTDGTSDMVRSEFLQVRLHRDEVSKGLIVQRNQAAKLAAGRIIISIDDDAELMSPSTVQQVVAEFDHPRVGAVAMPFIDVHRKVSHLPPPGSGEKVLIAKAYVGTAHALRRDIFLRLGGYREFLFHQGEESDYCVRLMAAGYVIRYGHSTPLHHYVSPRRDSERIVVYGARNGILYAWHNVPMPFFLAHCFINILNVIRNGFYQGRTLWAVRGILRGFLDSGRDFRSRSPVPATIYKLGLRLRHRPLPLGMAEPYLPPITSTSEIHVPD